MFREAQPASLPPAGAALVLLGEVPLQRGEVLEQRAGVHLACARDRLERRDLRLQLRVATWFQGPDLARLDATAGTSGGRP